MAYDKLKTEVYEMSGGVNTKASPYVNAPNEFRSIINMNFYTPGALTKRPGSSDYVGATFIGATTTTAILGGHEFNSITNNYYCLVTADTNHLYINDTNIGATVVPSGITNMVMSGLSTAPTDVFSFVTYSDRLIFGNGNVFGRYNASATYMTQTVGGSFSTFVAPSDGKLMSLPQIAGIGAVSQTFIQHVIPGGATFFTSYFATFPSFFPYTGAAFGLSGPFGSSALAGISYFMVGPGPGEGGFSGYISISAAFENDRGYIGPESAAFGGSILMDGNFSANMSIQIAGASYYNTFAAGVSAGAVNVVWFAGIDGLPRTLIQRTGISLLISYPAGGYFSAGGTIIVSDFTTVNIPLNTKSVAGFTTFVSGYGTPANSYLDMQNIKPRYLEIYNNQLFIAGLRGTITTYVDDGKQLGNYSQAVIDTPNESTIYFSEIGQPEAFSAENFIEFRTNDGDRITGIKSYAGSLIVTKRKSFHRLTGTDPTNFLVQESSTQYGCISNQAMVVWTNKLWFLDEKGICEYNGANVNIISNKVQPIFDSMNINAAIDKATAVHYKQQNEVWFAIPTGNSVVNDTIVVFDYLSDVWTVYKDLNPSFLFVSQSSLVYPRPFIGGYTGTVRYMDPTKYSDAGRSISCVIETRFIADSGQTTERQYRRFYLNVDPAGSTQAISLNFRTNFGTSNLLTTTFYENPYQTRIDFGLSARSIQAEIGHYSATLPFKVNGFAFESRFQRDT